MNDRRDLRGQVSEMGKETTPYRVYDPKLLKAMGMAFDAALNALPQKEGVRFECAGNWRC